MGRFSANTLTVGIFTFSEKTTANSSDVYYATIHRAVGQLNEDCPQASFHYWESDLLSGETAPLLCVTHEESPDLYFLTKFDARRGSGAMFPFNDSVIAAIMADREYTLALGTRHPRTIANLADNRGLFHPDEVLQRIVDLTFPVVVKNAVGGMCGNGVFYADTPDDVETILLQQCNEKYSKILVSEYVEGVEDCFYVIGASTLLVRRKMPPILDVGDIAGADSGLTLCDAIKAFFVKKNLCEWGASILAGTQAGFLKSQLQQRGLSLDSKDFRHALPLPLHFLPGATSGGKNIPISLEEADPRNVAEAQRVMQSVVQLGGAYCYGMDLKGGHLLDVNDVSLTLQLGPEFVTFWANTLQIYFETRRSISEQVFRRFRELEGRRSSSIPHRPD